MLTSKYYGEWFKSSVSEEDRNNNITISSKMVALFDIIAACEAVGDVLLVFSQSVDVLDVVEHFLKLVTENTANPNPQAKLNDYTGKWTRDKDYYRFEGNTNAEMRAKICKVFGSTGKNIPEYARARLDLNIFVNTVCMFYNMIYDL